MAYITGEDYRERLLALSLVSSQPDSIKIAYKIQKISVVCITGEDYRERLLMLNTCPLKQARFCVISRHEMTKCENMIMAFAAKNLKPDLNCILGHRLVKI